MDGDGVSARPWRSRLLELATIVLGILGAFGVDAAWERRGERAQETALLAALATDFEGARVDLERVMSVHDSVVRAADWLMSVSNPIDLPGADAEALSAAVVWTLANPTFDPPTGTVETILGSGRIDILRSEPLVRALTQWSAIVQDMKEDELVANEHLYSSLFPLFAEHLNLRDVVRTGPYVWPGTKSGIADFGFLLDDEVQSALWWLYALHTNVTGRSGQDVSAAVDRMIGILEDER